jgi:hypothetical protein
MTLPRLHALEAAWALHPPAAFSLARLSAALGAWRPPGAEAAAASGRRKRTREEIAADFAPLCGG